MSEKATRAADLEFSRDDYAELGQMIWHMLASHMEARDFVDDDAPGDIPGKMADAYIEVYSRQRRELVSLQAEVDRLKPYESAWKDLYAYLTKAVNVHAGDLESQRADMAEDTIEEMQRLAAAALGAPRGAGGPTGALKLATPAACVSAGGTTPPAASLASTSALAAEVERLNEQLLAAITPPNSTLRLWTLGHDLRWLAERRGGDAELAEILDRFRIAPINPSPSEVAAKDAVRCGDCGQPYSDPAWIEAVLPNEIWNEHFSGLLCIKCIAARCVALGLRDVPTMLTAGPLKTAEPRIAVLQAEVDRLSAALKDSRDKWDWMTLKYIAARMLDEVYPADVFRDIPRYANDPGAKFVNKMREAMAELPADHFPAAESRYSALAAENQRLKATIPEWHDSPAQLPPFGAARLCHFRESPAGPLLIGVCRLMGNESLSEWTFGDRSVLVTRWADPQNVVALVEASALAAAVRAKAEKWAATAARERHWSGETEVVKVIARMADELLALLKSEEQGT